MAIDQTYWARYYNFWDEFVRNWFCRKANPVDDVSTAFKHCTNGLNMDELPEPYYGTPHNGVKAEGTIEGTKRQVLAWMKKMFPDIRKAADQEMMPAWQFFYRGEMTTYETQDGTNLYLAEVVE